MMRSALTAFLLWIGSTGLVFGQVARTSPHRVEVMVQGSLIPLYLGDATVGPYAGTGPTLRLAVRPRSTGRMLVEGHATHTFGDDWNNKPSVTLAGVSIATLTHQRDVPGLSAWIGAGMEAFIIEVNEITGCEPPLCFAEGGGSFRDATMAGGVVDVGLWIPMSQFATRVHLRGHVPLFAPEGVGSSRQMRVEFGLGVSYRR